MCCQSKHGHIHLTSIANKMNQLSQGRKVLSTLDIISKLVIREQSISAVITSVANVLPH
ncbi:hypothetical protein FRX31_014421, partial [Thalictrum thalictroides]